MLKPRHCQRYEEYPPAHNAIFSSDLSNLCSFNACNDGYKWHNAILITAQYLGESP